MSENISRTTLCPFGVVGASHRLDAVSARLREPVFLLFVTSVKWLVLASVLGLVASIQTHTPDFFTSCAYISHGRLQPLFTNILVYGWGFNAAFAVALWLSVRLARVPMCSLWVVFVATIFWNVGVTVGAVRILLGHQIPMQYLEMPREAMPLMLIAYALIGVWGIVAFMKRERKATYISQVLVLAALFWFPWIYVVAQSIVVFDPAVGVVQNIVAGWYAAGLIHLWFIPIALGASFYVIPRVLGVSLKYDSLLTGAFWLYAVVACWACGRYFMGAPVPAWTQTVGIVASVALMLPVIVFLVSLFSTAFEKTQEAFNSPSVRFILTGLGFLGVYVVANALMMLRPIGEVVQFTHYVRGLDILAFYASVSMIFFGALYFILPGLLERQWLSTSMLKAHYWGTATGLLVIAASLLLAGVIQGHMLGNPDYTHAHIAQTVQPWLQLSSYGYLLVMIGNIGFAINFLRLLFPIQQQRQQAQPTCFEATE